MNIVELRLYDCIAGTLHVIVLSLVQPKILAANIVAFINEYANSHRQHPINAMVTSATSFNSRVQRQQDTTKDGSMHETQTS